MIRIDEESAQRSRYPFEIDNFCKRYVSENGYFIFTAPLLEVLEKYRYYLLQNSTIKKFDSKYKYRPSYMSMSEYGVPNLAFLLMYINNISCIEEFNLSTVIVPSMNAIVTLCYDKIDHGDVSEMEKVSW